jgi:flagellar protein FliJ
MKSHEALIRLKTFQVDDKQRKVVQIETMIAEFERMANDLDREIRVEQDRSGIHDPAHYAYPTYAKAAIARRDNLKHSADELRAQLVEAQTALQEACDERRKVELLGERDQQRERAAQDARSQADLDSLGILNSRAALA